MNWRRLEVTDIPAACELSRLAGWNQTPADWLGYLEFDPLGCFAAETDGRVVGTATSVRYENRVGWIGMVLVDPQYRRRGIGTDLLRHTIGYLQECGIKSIKLDATPAGKIVYIPLGFEAEYEVTRYETTVLGAAPDRAIPSPAAEALPELCAALDTEAFGVARPQVLRSLSRRQPQFCFGGPDGYLIARQGREAIQVGPWVALDPAKAEELLRSILEAAPAGVRLYLDLPAPNAAGLELLQRHGFRVQRSFTRMSLGSPGPRGRPEIVYGTSGAEKG